MRKRQGGQPINVSVIMPCLNEEETIGVCIKKTLRVFKKHQIKGEIIVADNGSTDNSVKIAQSLGAKVVFQSQKGYGSAYRKGFAAAQGKYLIMGDSDNTYDFRQISRFLKPLEQGYDLAIGSRFQGKIAPGAMSWSHRYLGNPLLSGILRFFFKTNISDAHCGMRGLTKKAYRKMKLKTTGMEFASEMIIKAIKNNLRITEVPVDYYPRKGDSKLRSLPDAWRHLRFMLLYSPTYLFLLPGGIIFLFGLGLTLILLPGPLYLFGRGFDTHTMILGSLLTITGFQIINIGMYAKIYAYTSRLEESRTVKTLLRFFNLEAGLILSGLTFLTGLLINSYIFFTWAQTGFGGLDEVRPAILALTLMVIGLQGIFSSFFLSILGIKRE